MNKKTVLMLVFIVLTVVLMSASAVRPDLTAEDESAIIDSVVKTVEADFISRLTANGYIGVAAALQPSEPITVTTPEPATPVVTEEPAVSSEEAAPEAEAAEPAERVVDNPADYWEGAVQQADGTYRGLHAKFFNSYAYTVGEDENGITKTFHTDYIPNERFNVDVVFENDGSTPWPAIIEMRHTGNSGEYTGHTESTIIDRSNNAVMPGDKCGFTVSAHGSENLGYITFFFKLYDAVSGTPIEGGEGSFSYLAR